MSSSLKKSSEESFKQEFQDCLEDLESTGTLASFDTKSQYINPGLHAEKFGTVELPLSIRDAYAIAAVCKQFPFGLKDQTVIDESIRKTWELDSSELTLTNPAWSKYLNTVAV